MNCPICNNKLVVVHKYKETVRTINNVVWSRAHSNYWCANCELNLVDHGDVRPESYPAKVTPADATNVLNSIRGV